MPEVTACLRLASAAVWDESVCAWEGAKAAGRGDAVKAAVQLQRVWGKVRGVIILLEGKNLTNSFKGLK